MSSSRPRSSLLPPSRRLALESAIAIAVVLLATGLRDAMDALLGQRVAFITYFAAIIPIAWRCSLVPTIVGVVLSLLLGAWFFVEPRHAFVPADAADALQIGLYAVVASGIAAVAQSARWSRERALAAEEAARASEASYRDLAERLPQLVWTTDTSGRFTYANRNWTEYTGLDLAASRETDWRPLVHPDDHARVMTTWKESFAAGQPYQVEFRMRRASDGAFRWYLIRAWPGRDAGGAIARWLGTSTDIHDLKTAQLEAALAERRLRATISHAPVVLWTIDRDGRYLSLEGRGLAAIGRAAEDLIGKDHFAIVKDSPESAANTRRALAGETVSGASFVGGRWYENSYGPTRDPDGRITGVLGVSQDVTERKVSELARDQMERDLRRSERFFRLKVDQSPIPMIVADARGKVLLVNAAMERTYGIAIEHLRDVDMRAATFVRSPAMREAIDRAYAGQATAVPVRQERIPFGPRAGAAIWLRSYVYPLTTEDGSVAEVVFVQDDVTELQEAQERLRENEARLGAQAAELLRSNAELEQFAYIAAHDLQEPVRMIVSYLQLVERHLGGSLDAKAKGYMDFVSASAIRMRHMVNAILEYSRIGKEGVQAAPISAADALAAALANLREKIASSGATVEQGELPTVVGVEPQVVRLFQNLVSNAIKFRSAAAPRVRVSARRDGERWVFAVDDNGIGIDPQHARRLFGLFQRLHPNDRYPGTGIGLAACKKIVEQHRGQIWFEPADGGGTSFRFTLPAAD